MRKRFSREFLDTFAEGFKFYVDGEWKKARKEFLKVPILKGSEDMPTQNLLDFMAKTNFVAPEDWTGIRIEGGGSGGH